MKEYNLRPMIWVVSIILASQRMSDWMMNGISIRTLKSN